MRTVCAYIEAYLLSAEVHILPIPQISSESIAETHARLLGFFSRKKTGKNLLIESHCSLEETIDIYKEI